MDYQYRSVWDVIKNFLIGWAVAGGILVIVSCIRHKEFIQAVFANSLMAWANALIPIFVAGFLIVFFIKSIFH